MSSYTLEYSKKYKQQTPNRGLKTQAVPLVLPSYATCVDFHCLSFLLLIPSKVLKMIQIGGSVSTLELTVNAFSETN